MIIIYSMGSMGLDFQKKSIKLTFKKNEYILRFKKIPNKIKLLTISMIPYIHTNKFFETRKSCP